jgi:hypothetical protein
VRRARFVFQYKWLGLHGIVCVIEIKDTNKDEDREKEVAATRPQIKPKNNFPELIIGDGFEEGVVVDWMEEGDEPPEPVLDEFLISRLPSRGTYNLAVGDEEIAGGDEVDAEGDAEVIVEEEGAGGDVSSKRKAETEAERVKGRGKKIVGWQQTSDIFFSSSMRQVESLLCQLRKAILSNFLTFDNQQYPSIKPGRKQSSLCFVPHPGGQRAPSFLRSAFLALPTG